MKVPMGPPPPKFRSLPGASSPPADSEPTPSTTSSPVEAEVEVSGAQVSEAPENKETPDKPATSLSSTQVQPRSREVVVPYSIPSWSEPPGHPFYFEVLKDGAILEQLDVSEKGAYMFGRVDLCDFVLEHPTISRFHAVLQFKKDGDVFLYDVGSTHGTFINKRQINKKVYVAVHVGDIVRFGQSSRLYIFQGPSAMMPPEGDLRKLRDAKIREEIHDREASLLRARIEASMADGISWGMSEDAIEDDRENDVEEVTWQTYKGQLTERQEKTWGKIIKRMEKVANMKKEIDAIRVKDISQGGLTQGQQTQIARNEQRISQLMEELDSLEETLNESIQESIGACVKLIRGKKKGASQDENEDEVKSDDDEFYDRTKKKPSLKKSGDQPSVETADSLLDKRDAIIEEMEDKQNKLEEEKAKMATESKTDAEDGDELDAYMTGLSSQLAMDKMLQIQEELSTLQSELDRVLYLLKIADPSGEAAKKKNDKLLSSKSSHAAMSSNIPKEPALEHTEATLSSMSSTGYTRPLQSGEASAEDVKCHAVEETKAPVFVATKPQWLGATKEMKVKEDQPDENISDANEADQFVDYKDRKILAAADDGGGLEHATSGLIIRKQKHVEEYQLSHNDVLKQSASTSPDAEAAAVDAVALLLKHKRGYAIPDDEQVDANLQTKDGRKPAISNKKKKVLGPERPTFLEAAPDYESWVPPEGQSGDGRTSLNERLGY